ncbi:MAG: hypoxanthine phosphoribosyltransferase [Hallerella sp.]|jgi:hypoxanthine phosphoribosyltransferase|nr:hypoxanthine phosphoribosyltransferase [Fibrobacter sp.]MDY6370172.1 hypoxanthine phosphoribosyltransferase [Fibrobacter sp.]MDY6391096.1 hypoxanthine phosphoribosyltransferase [Fibrobacter sp.]MEE3340178.1 hypoxanthine phosphoribosyltransferase [Hallerella sp.]
MNQNGLKVLISKEDLQKRVAELANEISQQKIDIVVGALTGAFIFVADLVRAMPSQNLKVQFVKASSYGSGTERSSFTVSGLEKLDIEGKNILLVDDIFDTGHTLCSLSKAMFERGAKTVRTCALLDKPSRREVDFDIDYRGFTIENLFVVGYGLDYAEEYRTLPDVCYFPEAK